MTSDLDHVSLHEGQGTTSRLQVTDADDAEQITRAVAEAAYVATHPAEGRVSRLLAAGLPDLEISPRRWGRRVLGQERVAFTTPWAGYRWGPVTLPGLQMQVLPGPTAYTSRAETPQPKGLVGAHRSARSGAAPSSRASGSSSRATGCAGSTGGSPAAPAGCTRPRPGRRRTRGSCW